MIEALWALGFFIAAAPFLFIAVVGVPPALTQGFLPFSLGSAFLIYLGSRPGGTELTVTAGLATAFWAVFVLVLHPGEGNSWTGIFTFMGITSVMMLGLRVVMSTRRRETIPIFWAAAFFVHGWMCLAFGLVFGLTAIPYTWDWNLYAFDVSLGMVPSFVLGRLIAKSPLLHGVTYLVYELWLPAVAAVHARQVWSGKQAAAKILPVAATTLVIGSALYFVLPGSGPVYAFANSFPWSAAPSLPNPLEPMRLAGAFRNALPSLHLALAILVCWHSREFGRAGRLLASGFLLTTIFATLALGEHYLVDLVVAVPFTLAMQAAWTTEIRFSSPPRWIAVVGGTVLTASWFVLLRFGARAMLVSPALPWTLVLFTLLLSAYLTARLRKASTARTLVFGIAPVRAKA